MTEFGANHTAYQHLADDNHVFIPTNTTEVLKFQLGRSIEVLDIAQWQKEGLLSLEIRTIGDVLTADEETIQQIHYVGEKRSRRIRNAAHSAVYEYLSG
jgi:ERCC4-type nuclease